jgi:glycine oxidase
MASEPGIAIAGAGLIGASIAWRLAQAGMRVSMFDAGSFGGETSSAGAGMLSPGGEFDQPSVWLDLGIESTRIYPAFVEELREESGISIDFHRCGCHQFVSEREQAEKRLDFQRAAGINVELTPEGLFYPEDGFVDPTHLLRALRAACVARGVRIAENHGLSAVNSREFAAFVIAAGAWSNRLQVTHGDTRVDLPQVKPIKGHLVGFDLEPGALGPMLRREHCYVLQRSNGFVVVGSTEEDVGFDRSIDSATCEQIHRQAAELWPALENARPSKRWIGFRPYAEVPRIGRMGNTNVWLAYGHFRNGILLAPLTARRIATEITQEMGALR